MAAAEEEATGDVTPTGAGAAAKMDDPLARAFSMLFTGGSGKRIYFGVLQQDVQPSEVPAADERAARRAVAAEQLVNIDMPERERRRLAGAAAAAGTAALAIGLLAFDAPALSRVAIGPPLFLAYGYLASAQTGL